MKNIIILFSVFFVFSKANAQKKQNVYYFKSNGKEVNSKDSADYIRVVQEPDSGETNLNLLEFYVDGKKKTVGKVSAFEPHLLREGAIMMFDKEGKRKEITTYEKGVPLGMSYHYFSNGKMHKQIEYTAFVPQVNPSSPNLQVVETESFNPNSKLIYWADSLGIEYVKDGNGHVKDVEIIGKNELVEEGDYKEGVKHGVWKGNETEFSSSFLERYEMGKLIGGESIRNGVKQQYTVAMVPPQFKGGIQWFYSYIGRSVKYPEDAVRLKITGTVILEFTIEKDGSVTEVIVKKSAFPSLDKEARRMVMSSPKWQPGTLRGAPIRVRYTIPLKFTMPQ